MSNVINVFYDTIASKCRVIADDLSAEYEE